MRGQAAAHAVGDAEGGAVHAERAEEVVLHVLAELLAARRLDHLAGKVDVDAVEPALAGIEQQRRGQRLVLAGDDARHLHRLHVLGDLGAPDVVAEARGVGEEVAQGDVALGLAGLGLAVGVEAVEHADLAQRGDHRLGRPIERKLAPLDELHGGGAGDRLGHRGDPHHGVGRHLGRLAQHPLAEAAFVGRALGVGRHGDHARHVALAHRILQKLVGCCFHGVPPGVGIVAAFGRLCAGLDFAPVGGERRSPSAGG